MIQSYYMILLLNTNYINTEIKHQGNASILRKKLNSLLRENDAVIRLNNSFKQEESDAIYFYNQNKIFKCFPVMCMFVY